MEKKKNGAKPTPGKAKGYPYHKKTVTDSATGQKLDAAKRPKKSKIPEHRAATGSELAKAIQWFPGHMTKAIREINESLANVDLAIEVCDARIPVSSRNPNLTKILNGKPCLTLMNKASLADPNRMAAWKKHFAERGETVIFTDCRTGTGINEIIPAVRTLLADKLEAYERKGMRRLPRAMILGVTNAGKSTLINTLCGMRKAKTEDRAGVTRSQQWVTVEGTVELLDTPGILWPKFDDENVGLHLAYTGAIKDDILDKEEISVLLLGELMEKYPKLLLQRYRLTQDDLDGHAPFEVFERIARARGLLIGGGDIDSLRCAGMLLDEFRDGRIGRVTLE